MDELESLEMTIMAKLLKLHEERIRVLEAALSVNLVAMKVLQEEVLKLKGAK